MDSGETKRLGRRALLAAGAAGVAAAVPSVAGRSIPIYLNKKVTPATKVGWIAIEKSPVA